MTDLDEMRLEIAAYFGGERAESLVFLITGAIAAAISALLWTTHGYDAGVARGIAPFAVIEIAVGLVTFARTASQAALATKLLSDDPRRYFEMETTRLRRVIIGFRVYRAIELGLLIVGIVIVLLWKKWTFSYGFGTGLVIQAAILLVLDLLGMRRAEDYLEAIRELVGEEGDEA